MQVDIELEGVKEALKMFDPNIVRKAANQALNRVAGSGKTEASKLIRTQYNIKAGRLSDYLKLAVKAKGDSMEAVITGRGRGLALSYFDAKQTARGRNRGAVTVKVKKSGGRKVVSPEYGNKPFIAQMPSGHVGVWVRGRTKRGGFTKSEKGLYGKHGDRYRKGKVREPLIQLFGPGVGGTFATKFIMDSTRERIAERFPVEFDRQLNWYLSRAK